MKVCKYCLGDLNYKGYFNKSSPEKGEIYDGFSLDEYFEHYSTSFDTLPKYDEYSQPLNEYSINWENISKRFRESKNWVCESCGMDCKNNKEFLHTHHIDGNRNNNDNTNLKALCRNCHAKQPGHEHLDLITAINF
jgi:hypothetical protein